jgi:hypothetical protein
MPTNRRRRTRGQRLDVQPWEAAWARGERLQGEDAAAPFFLHHERARDVLEAVHGVPYAEWLRTSGIVLRPGQLRYNAAHLGALDAVDIMVVEAGGDPWARR